MGERGPRPGEGGAPRKVIDIEVVRRAASIGCTADEIATLLGIARATFFNHLKEDPGLKDAIDEGRDQGRTTLRRLQWQRAHAGSDTMLIWLGKQLLGQRDRHEVEQTGTQTLQFQHLVAARASLIEINRQRAIEGNAVATETDGGSAPPTNGSTPPVDLMAPALE